MSEPLLNVMKIMLLAGLYLFFVRVLWSVFSQLRDPRSVARNQRAAATAGVPQSRATMRQPAPAAPAPSPSAMPAAGASAGVAVAAPPAGGHLLVIEPANLTGMTHALGNEITLGRAPTNGIMLDDTYVSTVHARIFLTNGTYFIEDLASRNGSMLNGEQLVATTALVPGDRVQFGATVMEFM